MKKIFMLLVLMSLLMVSAASAAVVSSWNFDEGVGTVAVDSVGGHNATVQNGPNWVAGKVGTALDFDGVDDYALVGNFPAFDFGSSPFSISAWVKPEGVHDIAYPSGGPGAIVSKYDSAWKRQWAVTHRQDKTFSFYSSHNGYTHDIVNTPQTFGFNQWYHVVATADGSTKKIYVDGQLLKTEPYLGVHTANSPVLIGALRRSVTAPDVFFNGIIDEIVIWDNALSEQEIQTMINGSPDLTPATVPQNLSGTADVTHVALTWDASFDAESGIDHYNLFRDNVFRGSASFIVFTDATLTDGTHYTYEVSAVNGAGLESARSSVLHVNTLNATGNDTLNVTSIVAWQNFVNVTFDQALNPATVTPGDFAINRGIGVLGVSLSADQKTVTLTTTDPVRYELTVTNVADNSGNVLLSSKKGYSVMCIP